MTGPRDYCLHVRGFDFSRLYVRARSRGQARIISARSYKDAGWGSIREGLRVIKTAHLAPPGETTSLRVVARHGAPEGCGLLG